jgi:CHAT domain-containing protein
MLEYVVGPEGLFVFVVTRHDVAVKALPVRAADLTARVALLRDLIERPGDDRWLKPATRLSADLIEPIEQAGWLEGVKRLQVVPHGVLTYLPFAVLPRRASGPGALLVDHYTIGYLPAAVALMREPAAPGTGSALLAVAPSRGGLRYAPEEARAVDAMFRPASRMLLGRDATEASFKALAGGFRMLHLATHGHFNEANPLLSGLELEPGGDDDGMLQVHEILDLQLDADLVTLSACDTALGTGYFTSLPQGDEFVGLNRAFLAAGSASVMATLWRVDDRASVSLMKRFYGRLGASRGETSAAGALAAAQREHRNSGELGHPYYWAAYVLVGQSHRDVEVPRKLAGRKS